MIKYILFDLDGTLLPMEQKPFVKAYFSGLAKKLAPLGYEPNLVIDAVVRGVGAMTNNDGRETNEIVFWNNFAEILGEEVRKHQELFENYYKKEFQELKNVCGFEPMAKEVIGLVKEKGFKVALATSPVFPRIATESRIRWAGLELDDFEIVTTYEDYSYAKPNLRYYKEVLLQLNVKPEECVMIGNDVQEDMIASELGMKTFLLTNCLINRTQQDISEFAQGGFLELVEFIKNL